MKRLAMVVALGLLMFTVNCASGWAQGTAAISGHFAVWDGENGNLQNQTATGTFNVHIDGVTVHETIHMSLSASGISTSFDKPVLSCR